MADYTIIQIKIKKDKLQLIKEYSHLVGLPMTAFCRMVILEKINKKFTIKQKGVKKDE